MQFVFFTPDPDPPGGAASVNAGLPPALRAAGHEAVRGTDPGSVPPGAVPVVDGMCLPVLEPALDTLVAAGAVALIHHVAAASGQDKDQAAAVRAAEARMLPRFRRVIATSQPVARRLVETYGLTGVEVLVPGLPVLPRSPGHDAAPCRLLSAGVITPRKAHDRLLRALVRLVDLDWTLTIAGDAERNAVHAHSIAALVTELGLDHRVRILPNPGATALEAEWAGADLFVLTSTWEGYPASVAEALRRGLPVVACGVNEIPELVPSSAGIIAPPDDMVTFGKCLRRAIMDTALRRSLADGAWAAGQALPGWADQAQHFLSLVRS